MYYRQILRQRMYTSIELNGDAHLGDDTPHRIFLLPAHPLSHAATASSGSAPASHTRAQIGGKDAKGGASGVIVYAPVPFESLSEAQARELEATEAWVSQRTSQQQHVHSHRQRMSVRVRTTCDVRGALRYVGTAFAASSL